ncbi:MAG: recombination protein RecR [Candidatus Omnitrophica bacterium]|nr:recombination protein RecR [Candidatus Omnitrophota bacterium]
MGYPKVIEDLIESLMKLPGIGRRSAERIIFWLLDHSDDDAAVLAERVLELKAKLRFCRLCNNFTEIDTCPICTDQTRDSAILCVVENPKDAMAIEKTGFFKGQYFVLLGTVAPSEGQGLEDLALHKLFNKIKADGVTEVVIATDADLEGELTALHLIKALRPLDIKVSRIGIGLPAGGAVEFADMSTLSMSFKSRREVVPLAAQGSANNDPAGIGAI